MSDNLNEQIALKLGWRKLEGWELLPEHGDKPQWKDPSPNYLLRRYHDNPPDFEHEWKHAGPLWAELVRNLGTRMAMDRVGLEVLDVMGMYPSEDELKAATCRAWLAWKEEINP